MIPCPFCGAMWINLDPHGVCRNCEGKAIKEMLKKMQQKGERPHD